MDYKTFKNSYEKGEIRASANRSESLLLTDTSELDGYKSELVFIGKALMIPLIIGGIISLFSMPWYIGVAMVVTGLASGPIAQNKAAEAVIKKALDNEEFYKQVTESGILLIDEVDSSENISNKRLDTKYIDEKYINVKSISGILVIGILLLFIFGYWIPRGNCIEKIESRYSGDRFYYTNALDKRIYFPKYSQTMNYCLRDTSFMF